MVNMMVVVVMATVKKVGRGVDMKEIDHLGDLGIDDKLILKCI
jgi:hypothetical protein